MRKFNIPFPIAPNLINDFMTDKGCPKMKDSSKRIYRGEDS